MPPRTLLLCALAALPFFVFVIPTWTAPVPKPKPAKAIANSIGMKLMRIEPGKFIMGSPTGEKDRKMNEEQHEVEITKAFFMGVYPVTQSEYEKVMGNNPSWFSANGGGKDKVGGLDTSKFPVDQVKWDEAVAFCEKLTILTKGNGGGYRLPTEAEWEFACRADTKTRFHAGDGEDDLKKAGWYKANSDGRTHAVGEKKPNAWGLYDMHGNVSQWCSDWHGADYYKKSGKRDPKGPQSGRARVLRGGSWELPAMYCRTASRDCLGSGIRNNIVGFRVVCVPSGK